MSGFVAESPNAQRQVEQEGRVDDLPRANFVLFYHPAEWQLTHDGELTPSISHMSLAPGAGADENGDFTHRRSQLLKRGWVEIPHDVLGEELPDYVAKYTNKYGKAVCRTIFQQPYNDATRKTRWRYDEEAGRAFVQFLRKRGIIKQPTPEVVEGLLVAQERLLARLATVRPADNEAAHAVYRSKLERCEHAISVLRAELGRSRDLHGAPAAPARSALLRLLQKQEEAEEATPVALVRKRGKRREPEPAPTPAPSGFTADDEDDE